MRAASLVVALLLGGIAEAAPPAPPPPEVIPATGAAVGRNAKIWVFDAASSSAVQLYDSSGAQVTVTTTRVAVPPFQAFDKLSPDAPLHGGTYEVRDYSGVVSTFAVRDEDDTTPPPQPQVEIAATGKIGSAVSSVRVTGPTSSDSFLVVMGTPQTWEPPSAFGAGSKGSVIAYDFPAGPQHFKVIRVDASGNASEPVEVTATVPKDRACSVAPVLPVSLLALMLLKRRRR